MRASQNISRSNSMMPSRNYGILCVLTFPLLKRLALQFIPVSSCAETMKTYFVVYFAGPSILYHPRHFNAVPYLANNSCSFQSPAVFRPVRQALCFSFVSLPTWVDLLLHSRRSKLYHDLYVLRNVTAAGSRNQQTTYKTKLSLILNHHG
jgi:hypothetical protein